MSSSARIEELRKKFDENPRRYFAPLANEYRKAGDFDQAIFICQEYLPQQPGHMSGHIVFGQALFEAKRLPEARTVFETALSLDPENLIALRHLADISRDLGETEAARGWYERVLHADPRNEEIAAIVASLGAPAAAPAVAPTLETPTVQAPPPTPAQSAASAPTVELSAAAVQEMLKARNAAKAPPPAPLPEPEAMPELMSLDAAPTVEINAVSVPEPEPEPASGMLDGLEPTSQAADTMDLGGFESLGVETNAAPGEHAVEIPQTIDSLETTSLDISMPLTRPAPAAAQEAAAETMEIPMLSIPSAPAPAAAAPEADTELLDLGSFGMGSAAPPPTPAEAPIDGGHDDSMELLDLDLPPAPSAPAPEPASIPTMIMDAVTSAVPAVTQIIEDVAPAVMDAMESVAPPMMDLVDTTIPSVVDTVTQVIPTIAAAVAQTPTVVMEAIRTPVTPTPPAEAVEPSERPAAPAFVTETMAQLYLGQGHRDEALDIYRKLIDARPDDAALRARYEAIKAAGERPVPQAPAPIVPTPAAPAAIVSRFTGSGPSIRDVLRNLFGVEGTLAGSAESYSSGTPGEIGSIDRLFSADAVAEGLSPLAVAFDGGFVAGTGDIDELFAGGQ